MVLVRPAMAINGYRNKPIGPGGGTRRLHHKPLMAGCQAAGRRGGFCWGRNRIDEGVKGTLSLGMVPPYRAILIVANDNYAPVALAA